jgi:choline/glycine/proline betaine transport protein
LRLSTSKTFNPVVFITSAVLIISIACVGIFFRESFQVLTSFIHTFITHQFGWLLLLMVAAYLLLCIYLGFSRFGSIKLGPDDSKPDYSYLSWISMLFSAGMGIGLLFYGVAEPMMHFTAPPGIEPKSIEAAKFAMQTTYFHWGVHAWAIYVVVGMSLAYFCFRKGETLSLRSALKPLFGDRMEGFAGDFVDIFAILGTLFGVATSLGLGAMQVNSGLNYLLGIENSIQIQILIIAAITALATISVVTGLNRGIKFLSEFNMILASIVLILIFILGPTVAILNIATQSGGHYFQTLIEKTFNVYAFSDQGWVTGWTIFYWAWWLSWAPFVGVFIARISRGRTIREFILNVIFIPTLMSILWFSTFGGTAIHLEINGITSISEAVNTNMSTAIFHFLQQFPFPVLLCSLAIVIVITFFVTSSDSGSLVIDMLAANGHPDPPTSQRIFWAVLEGLVAAVLLWGGGQASLKTLQTGAVATGLPLGILILLMGWSLVKALRAESLDEEWK